MPCQVPSACHAHMHVLCQGCNSTGRHDASGTLSPAPRTCSSVGLVMPGAAAAGGRSGSGPGAPGGSSGSVAPGGSSGAGMPGSCNSSMPCICRGRVRG